MPKIIAFTGAGGTGKTTVAEALFNNVPSMVDYLRKNFYGSTAHYGDLTSIDEIIRFQYGILFGQYIAELLTISNIDEDVAIVPIERSSIDYAAYMLNQSDFIMTKKKYTEKQSCIKHYVEQCIEHANKNYNGIVYFPTGIFEPADKDGSSKERDDKSINKTNSYIQSLITRVNIPVLQLKSKEVKSRVKAVKQFAKLL